MSTRVQFTDRADQQAHALNKKQREQVAALIRQLRSQGCAALDYRLTGDTPVERLCVKHLGRNLRAVVAFRSPREAWVLLVGPHTRDPGMDVYGELYELVGFIPPDSERRRKPPCCENADVPPLLDDDQVESLVDRAVQLRKTRQR